ncbi:MAG: hypothetical protein IMZ74_17250 [Actinobacteria bacterium]|nr:hypothetical protein [Actinomycetota bacterium]
MRKWIVVALALALALAVVPLAAAGNGGGGDKGKGKLKFELVGTVSPVAGATGLTVKVKAGTKTVKSVLDSTRLLGLVVDPAPRVRLVTDKGCVDGTLADLVQGMKVKVRGRIDRTTDPATFIAVWIKAKMMPTPEPSSPLPSPAP